jgi:hypothetical protein
MKNLFIYETSFYIYMESRGMKSSRDYDPRREKRCSKCLTEGTHHEFDCKKYLRRSRYQCKNCNKGFHWAEECDEPRKYKDSKNNSRSNSKNRGNSKSRSDSKNRENVDNRKNKGNQEPCSTRDTSSTRIREQFVDLGFSRKSDVSHQTGKAELHSETHISGHLYYRA